ncbi:adenylate cyclase-like protein [Trypanosoma conorhini]|uniref:Adenylate cyclase-like protein n=1 Tax=Trypanosoma conorhini TaxID=83891 RepID=A0A3R7LIB9_9TRYP|nr:adenylate cyclase-like protein [Trypanosoma conorhini]RNF15040.1 adenylate cyclase-like protein [Trypanosoma conorhini]
MAVRACLCMEGTVVVFLPSMGCGHSMAAASEGASAAQAVGRGPGDGNTGAKCIFAGVAGNDPTDGQSATDSSHCVFRNALSSAVEQIYLMQRSGVVSLDDGEMEEVTALTRGLDNLQANQKEDRFSLLGSWRILEKEGTVNLFGQRIYEDMMERDPEIKELLFGIEIPEQSKVLARMFATAVTFYARQDVMQRMFLAIGAQHRAYGAVTRHVNQMQQSFFRVFPAFVGQDVFDRCQEEWRQFWFTLTECFERGSRSQEGDKYGKLRELQMVKQLQEDFALIKQRQDGLEMKRQFVGVIYGKAIEMEPTLHALLPLWIFEPADECLSFWWRYLIRLGTLKRRGKLWRSSEPGT